MHPLAKLACRSAGAKAKGTGASASRVKRATSATSRPGGQPAQRHGKERSFERKRSLPSGHSSRSARLVACATSFRRQSKIRDRACVEALLKPLMDRARRSTRAARTRISAVGQRYSSSARAEGRALPCVASRYLGNRSSSCALCVVFLFKGIGACLWRGAREKLRVRTDN
jgi:hypothetical protein